MAKRCMRRSRLGGASGAALLALFVPRAAVACSVCFGDPNSPATAGMNNAILFLLGCVGLLWVGMIAFVVSMRVRARRRALRREQFHLLEGGAR